MLNLSKEGTKFFLFNSIALKGNIALWYLRNQETIVSEKRATNVIVLQNNTHTKLFTSVTPHWFPFSLYLQASTHQVPLLNISAAANHWPWLSHAMLIGIMVWRVVLVVRHIITMACCVFVFYYRNQRTFLGCINISIFGKTPFALYVVVF